MLEKPYTMSPKTSGIQNRGTHLQVEKLYVRLTGETHPKIATSKAQDSFIFGITETFGDFLRDIISWVVMTLLDILRGQAANLQKAPPLCDLTRPHLYIYLNALGVVPINKNVVIGQKLSPGFSCGEKVHFHHSPSWSSTCFESVLFIEATQIISKLWPMEP